MPDNGQNVKKRTYIYYFRRHLECKVVQTNNNFEHLVSISTRSILILKDTNVAKDMSHPNNIYIVFSIHTGKVLNKIVFVCKSHYIDCLIKALGSNNSWANPTYTPTTFTQEKPLDNYYWSVLCSLRVSTRFLNYTNILTYSVILIGLPNASRNHFPKSAVEIGLQNYCDTSYSRVGMKRDVSFFQL